jgi:hypothetical protein
VGGWVGGWVGDGCGWVRVGVAYVWVWAVLAIAPSSREALGTFDALPARGDCADAGVAQPAAEALARAPSALARTSRQGALLSASSAWEMRLGGETAAAKRKRGR